MGTTTIAFAGGVSPIQGFGSRQLVGFNGTWAAGEHWAFELVSPTLGNIQVGLGQLAGLTPTCLLNFKQRVYIGLGTRFAFSDNDLPTNLEEQDPGAGFVDFMSNFGSQDAIACLGVLQGRLVVLGNRSIQIWTANGDPKQFNLAQVLDNIGTNAPLSGQQVGDYDFLFLDPDTGVRSLRSREVTLNAYVDDLGVPIDSLIQAALVGYDASGACGVVDPVSKRYWLFLKDKIYVFSMFRSSKISAWTTFLPTYDSLGIADTGVVGTPDYTPFTTVVGSVYYWTKGASGIAVTNGNPAITASGYFIATSTTTQVSHAHSDTGPYSDGSLQLVTQTAFTPEKFVVYNRRIYVRGTDNKIYLYGGTGGTTYDTCIATHELPWLDLSKPTTVKEAHGIDVAMGGAWTIKAGMNPSDGATSLETVLQDGSTTSPSEAVDSSFDKGNIPYQARGTHFKLKSTSSPASAAAAWISALTFKYKDQYKT